MGISNTNLNSYQIPQNFIKSIASMQRNTIDFLQKINFRSHNDYNKETWQIVYNKTICNEITRTISQTQETQIGDLDSEIAIHQQ